MGLLNRIFGGRKKEDCIVKTTHQLGALRRMKEITLTEMQEYPIWVNDLSGEWKEGFDVTSERPVVGATEVTPLLMKEFGMATVLIRFCRTGEWGIIYYEGKGKFSAAAVWHDGVFVDGCQILKVSGPAEFEVVPSIYDLKKQRFTYDPNTDKGN